MEWSAPCWEGCVTAAAVTCLINLEGGLRYLRASAVVLSSIIQGIQLPAVHTATFFSFLLCSNTASSGTHMSHT